MADNKYNFYQTNWKKKSLKNPAQRLIKKVALQYVVDRVLKHGLEKVEQQIKDRSF